MFQNDITFNFCDFSGDEPDLEKSIHALVEKHESESIAAPYLFIDEIDIIREELPSSWSLSTDQSSKLREDQIRVTVYHSYPEAQRNFDSSVENVKLVAEFIGGDFLALTTVESSSEESQLLELDSAWGESPITICVTPGGGFGREPQEFDIESISDVTAFVESLQHGSHLVDDDESEQRFTSEDVPGIVRAVPPLSGDKLLKYMQEAGDKPEHVLCYEAGYVIDHPDGTWSCDMPSLMMAMF
jgi:hypothetical protein